MSSESDTGHTVQTSSPNMTKLLTCGWGLAACYILFDGVLVRHAPLASLSAVFPLIAVWATLEGKRWGRLALLGMCRMAPAVFVAALILAPLWLRPTSVAAALRLGTQMSVESYGSSASTGLILLLSIATGFWLRRPIVAAEFDKGKRPVLARAQRQIAACLVFVWGALIAMPPVMAGVRLGARPTIVRRSALATGPVTLVQFRSVSSRISRSAAPDSSR